MGAALVVDVRHQCCVVGSYQDVFVSNTVQGVTKSKDHLLEFEDVDPPELQ